MNSRGYRNYYKILGVEPSATKAEIKRSFRKLAREYHPDVNPGNKEAESKFKEINEAYAVLIDSEKRKKYTKYGQYWDQSIGIKSNPGKGSDFDIAFGNYGNFDEFINDLLGNFGEVGGKNSFSSDHNFSTKSERTPKNLDAQIKLQISFEEAFRGTKRTLSINGERVQVKIPRGIKSGSKLRLKGKGNLQPGLGRRGDLYLNIDVEPHKIWYLEGEQLRGNLPVSFEELVLGATVKIKIPDGEALVNIPAGTIPEQNLRLKEKGWPLSNRRGDLLVTLKMNFPTTWSQKELELIQELQNFRSYDPRKDWFKSA